MTLAEVAAVQRKFPWRHDAGQAQIANWVVDNFELDPDFDLRARIEKLAGELESSYQEDRLVARRLREVLGESK